MPDVLLMLLVGLGPLLVAWALWPFVTMRERWQSPERRSALEQQLVMRSRKRQVVRQLRQVSRDQRR